MLLVIISLKLTHSFPDENIYKWNNYFYLFLLILFLLKIQLYLF